MEMLHIKIPRQARLDSTETTRFLAAKLFESGRLSLGQAAKMAKLSKMAFAEILVDYDVSIINHPISEIKDDAEKI